MPANPCNTCKMNGYKAYEQFNAQISHTTDAIEVKKDVFEHDATVLDNTDANILLISIGSSEYDIECAHSELADIECRDCIFIQCSEDGCVSEETYLKDMPALDPAPELVVITASKSVSVEQLLMYAKIVKEKLLPIIVVTGNKDCALNKDDVLACTDCILYVSSESSLPYHAAREFIGFVREITTANVIQLDIADVVSVLNNAGFAQMIIGTFRKNASECMKDTVSKSFLADVLSPQYKAALIHVKAYNDITLPEFDAISQYINNNTYQDINHLYGLTVDRNASDEVQVSVIALDV